MSNEFIKGWLCIAAGIALFLEAVVVPGIQWISPLIAGYLIGNGVAAVVWSIRERRSTGYYD